MAFIAESSFFQASELAVYFTEAGCDAPPEISQDSRARMVPWGQVLATTKTLVLRWEHVE
jgi:hypothetical protein